MINLNLIWKETCQAEHEYMNIHTPINILRIPIALAANLLLLTGILANLNLPKSWRIFTNRDTRLKGEGNYILSCTKINVIQILNYFVKIF